MEPPPLVPNRDESSQGQSKTPTTAELAKDASKMEAAKSPKRKSKKSMEKKRGFHFTFSFRRRRRHRQQIIDWPDSLICLACFELFWAVVIFGFSVACVAIIMYHWDVGRGYQYRIHTVTAFGIFVGLVHAIGSLCGMCGLPDDNRMAIAHFVFSLLSCTLDAFMVFICGFDIPSAVQHANSEASPSPSQIVYLKPYLAVSACLAISSLVHLICSIGTAGVMCKLLCKTVRKMEDRASTDTTSADTTSGLGANIRVQEASSMGSSTASLGDFTVQQGASKANTGEEKMADAKKSPEPIGGSLERKEGPKLVIETEEFTAASLHRSKKSKRSKKPSQKSQKVKKSSKRSQKSPKVKQ